MLLRWNEYHTYVGFVSKYIVFLICRAKGGGDKQTEIGLLMPEQIEFVRNNVNEKFGLHGAQRLGNQCESLVIASSIPARSTTA